jgi:hypothetical protein
MIVIIIHDYYFYDYCDYYYIINRTCMRINEYIYTPLIYIYAYNLFTYLFIHINQGDRGHLVSSRAEEGRDESQALGGKNTTKN